MFNAEFNCRSHKNKAFSYKTIALLSVLTAVGISSPAEAINLTRTWILKDVTFNDGATAKGHFNFNAHTHEISDVHIEVKGPIYEGSFDDTSLNLSNFIVEKVLELPKVNSQVLALVDTSRGLFDTRGVGFGWAKPLTSKESKIPISVGAYGKTKFAFPPFEASKLSGGYIHAKPVPEPLTIIGTGFAFGFGVFFKKKKGLSQDTN